jgi:P pilus assembly chaperone PapD
MRFPVPAAVAAALSLLAPMAPAAAELMIAPTRVVLGPGQRTTELVLVNRGTEAAAYRLQVENRRMRADGAMEAAETARPGELFAADMVRFAPRQLVLEPGARQTVRITASLPEGAAAGEYRSHLRLMSAPVSAGQSETKASDDKSLSIELIAVRSLTIPVLVRSGTLEAEAKVTGAAFSKAAPEQLIISMARSGDRSVYGDIRLTPAGAKEPAYVVRGIAIYTPNTARDVVLPLPAAVRTALAGHQVRIDYVSADPAAPGVTSSATVGL